MQLHIHHIISKNRPTVILTYTLDFSNFKTHSYWQIRIIIKTNLSAYFSISFFKLPSNTLFSGAQFSVYWGTKLTSIPIIIHVHLYIHVPCKLLNEILLVFFYTFEVDNAYFEIYQNLATYRLQELTSDFQRSIYGRIGCSTYATLWSTIYA